MRVKYVLLTEDNIADFESVFPPDLKEDENRIAIGAFRSDGGAVGAVSCVQTSQEYALDWIFVEPEVRRGGIGTGLMNELREAVRLTGEVLPTGGSFPVNGDDVSLHRFFLNLADAEVSYSHRRYTVSPEDLQNAVLLHKVSQNKKAEEFFAASEVMQRRILYALESCFGYEVTNPEKWNRDAVKELCLFTAREEDVTGCILVQKNGDRELELGFLYGASPDVTMGLLSLALQKKEALFPEASVSFETINEESEQLAERLFPDSAYAGVYELEW